MTETPIRPPTAGASMSRAGMLAPLLDAHLRSGEEVLTLLEVSDRGLSEAEAKSRRERHGPNALPEGKRRGLPAMVVGQFSDLLILLLLAAAAISGFLGEVADTVAILVIVVLNAIIGVVQEYRAERALEALQKMTAGTAAVRREGQTFEIPVEELTLGDVVLLDAGRSVPADLRLLEVAQLRASEAALTGESVPVDKSIDAVATTKVAVGERTNMAFRGTQIVHGRGVGVVTAIGLDSQVGKIAGLLQTTFDVETPLQKRLARFGKGLAAAALGLCAVVFVLGILRGEDAVKMLLTALSLAVAAVPEALPAVATVTLALGARKLVKTNALVRRLPAVETLGSVTFICSDKTGTLTLNRMKVQRTSAGGRTSTTFSSPDSGPGPGPWLAKVAMLANDIRVDASGEYVGDPTEIALVTAGRAAGWRRDALEAQLPRRGELPFDSERKLMTTIHEAEDGSLIAFTKGAAETVLERSRAMMADDGTQVPVDTDAVTAEVERWAADGLRVLAFAMHHLGVAELDSQLGDTERELVFLGLVGMEDPPRPEAIDAVRTCKNAGIVPVLITGDHPATAFAIAHRLGIAERANQMATGTELEELGPEDLEQRVRTLRVYARVAPEQKLQIVEALQAHGEFVAMTGDGVNDAPALARAEIGVAMGITGTDVAKEAASMILIDDNFASIVMSIREGRRIFDNIRKFIKYTMTSNSGEIWTILFAPFLGLPIPLLPIHILWINLVTDGLPGLAFAAEPAEDAIMRRPPRPPTQSIFAEGLGAHMIWVGLLMGGASLATQALAMHWDMHWQTMVFTVLCLSQMGHAVAIRSDRRSAFTLGLFTNPAMAVAVAITMALQLATIYVPFLQPVFETEALSLEELAVALGMSTIVFWAVEAEKLWRRWFGRAPD